MSEDDHTSVAVVGGRRNRVWLQLPTLCDCAPNALVPETTSTQFGVRWYMADTDRSIPHAPR